MSQSQTLPEFIGMAEMDEFKVIILMLHARLPNGDYGHSRLYVRPSDAKYQDTLAHLGGLEPGQSKPVRPWS